MDLIKKVKRWGGSYCFPIDKKFIDDGLLDTDSYYKVTVEKCRP